MPSRRTVISILPAIVLLGGCATLAGRDPVQVQLVGLDPLDGEGMELRFACKLRVQNPNDTPIDYSGVFIDVQVRGSSFATGVSDAAGTIPRYGDVVLSVPVTASALRLARVGIGLFVGGPGNRIDYVLKGKIAGTGFGAVRFESAGELTLPGELTGAAR